MKKLIILAALLCTLLLTGCNNAIIDVNFKFDKAIIKISDEETIEVEVKRWQDYDNSDVVQVTATDGTVYLTHYNNIILVKEG